LLLKLIPTRRWKLAGKSVKCLHIASFSRGNYLSRAQLFPREDDGEGSRYPEHDSDSMVDGAGNLVLRLEVF
jgi:hypothetical protein